MYTEQKVTSFIIFYITKFVKIVNNIQNP